MTAPRHAQHPDGEPVNAGRPTLVAAKAAAIDAAQAHPLTWKTLVKQALAVAVAGVAIYLVLDGDGCGAFQGSLLASVGTRLAGQ